MIFLGNSARSSQEDEMPKCRFQRATFLAIHDREIHDRETHDRAIQTPQSRLHLEAETD